MAKRLLPALVLLIALAGLGTGTVQAQEASSPLSPVARTLTRYALAPADLPAGSRLTGAPEESTNEDVAASDPDQAALIRRNGRFAEIDQVATRAGKPGTIVAAVILFRDAEGAWSDALDSTFPTGVRVESTVPGPPVGQRSVLFHYEAAGTQTSNGQSRPVQVGVYQLIFQRDRLELAVSVQGLADEISVDEILPLAQAMDAKVLASPPGPVTAAEEAMLEEPTPTVLVRGAARILVRRFFKPISAAEVLTDAWASASETLRRAGVSAIPPVPLYSTDDDEAAIALHMLRFPELERLAEGHISQAQLAASTLGYIAGQRNDCHTGYVSAAAWQRTKAQLTGESFVAFGISFAQDEPLRLVSVLPGSPAKAAGLRAGQIITAINGRSIAGLGISEARALLDPTEGVVTTFSVLYPSGRTEQIAVAPARFSLLTLESEILPGNIGVMRFYTFPFGDELLNQVRTVLTSWEAQGVQGWIIDMRENGGGQEPVDLDSLFTTTGRLYGNVPRQGNPSYRSASGRPLPFQRPLVFLVGPGSASSGEIFPGSLQVRGRAVLVGEKTAGCVGSTEFPGLLDGSVFQVTVTEVTIGPENQRLNGVGVSPNIEVAAPTADEDAAGMDPQQDAAIGVLRELIRNPDAPILAPPAPTTSAAVWSI